MIYSVDAKDILERVARLREEMQEIQELNSLTEHRLDRTHEGVRAYEMRRNRLKEIRQELSGILKEFQRTGTD
jgi:predicted nuclease with TOPRIM domain